MRRRQASTAVAGHEMPAGDAACFLDDDSSPNRACSCRTPQRATLLASASAADADVRPTGTNEMKRDWELIRKMLLAIEGSPSGWAPELKFPGYTDTQVGYHAYLLIDAGLSRGDEVSQMGSEAPEGMITSLTWAGHEFAEAAQDETRWKKAMGLVADKGGSITLDVMKELLVSLMKGAFGLS